MSRFSHKGSKIGYQKSSNIGSSSVGSSEFGSRKGKGVEMPSNVTMIKDIEPTLDNITVQGRVISLWHNHRVNEAHNPYSLDFVFQDSQNNRIQVYIKKYFMFRFEPLFEEGKCYSIANFAIAENSGRLPLLPHKYKISFYKGTTVTRIDPIDDNVHGFILEPFNRLLDKVRVYHDHEAVDVIGSVVAIRYVVPVQSSAGRKIHRSVVIEDVELIQPVGMYILGPFWDHSATMWDEYAQKRNELGHVVFILQLEKVKYWNGAPSIHNALFGTKMFINRDVPEILAFDDGFDLSAEYEESQFTIEVFTPGKPVVTIAEFFHGKSYCIVYAKIHKIHKESGWAYTACKQCNKKVNVVETKATTSFGKSKVTFYCEDDGAVQAKSSFKELMEKHGMDVDEYWPPELDKLVGKRFLFKLWYSDYNVNNNNHTYRCDAFNDDADMIKHFKAGFMDDE
ncbi:replication protein A 70 kDa DNA-binding subunit B, partial [Tanacetum coccineum]